MASLPRLPTCWAGYRVFVAGFDLGTTYTAAAVADDAGVRMVNLGADAAAAPSVLHLGDASAVLAGQAALSRALVEPGATASEFKRRLGSPTPYMLAGTPYSAQALMGRLLSWALAIVAEREGGAPERIALTHPASWGAFKREMLDQVAIEARLECDVLTLSEPEAAAIAYAMANRVDVGETFAVYDLGGGTFDAAVLARTDDGFEMLGTPTGVDTLGGLDFDAAVFDFVLQSCDLDIETLDEADVAVEIALRQLRQSCIAAKIALSTSTDAVVPVLLPQKHTNVRITREDFERRIRPLLDTTVYSLERALVSANVEPGDISRVLLVGGSSRIPLVGQLVSETIGRPVALDSDPKNAVARGAAIAAGRQLTSAFQTATASPPPSAPSAEVEPEPPPVVAHTTPAPATPSSVEPARATPTMSQPAAPPITEPPITEPPTTPAPPAAAAPTTAPPSATNAAVTDLPQPIPAFGAESSVKTRTSVPKNVLIGGAAMAVVIALIGFLVLRSVGGGGDEGDEVVTSATDASAESAASGDVNPQDDAEAEQEAPDDETVADETPSDESSDDSAEPVSAAVFAPAGQGGELRLLQWQSPAAANPYLAPGPTDVLASSLVLEPLASLGPDGLPEPSLATQIPTSANGGVSSDLTRITWELRDDVLWSDGTPFTADDVVFTWEYCTNINTGCASDRFSLVSAVSAIDDHTVTISFVEPVSYPYGPFVGFETPVLQRAQFLECVGTAAQTCTAQNTNPIGTGPFVITEFRVDDGVDYRFNENFRRNEQGQPFFETVVIDTASDAEDAARAVLESGMADYAWNLAVAPEILNGFEAAGQGEILVAFRSYVEHINLNQTNNRASGNTASNFLGGSNPNPFFFDNPELARALSLAIDRDELVRVAYGDSGDSTCNMWHVEGQRSANNDACLVQDLTEANRILDQDLGYLDTNNDGIRELPDGTPLMFDFASSTNAVRQAVQELIETNWADLGVGVTMRAVSASEFFDGSGLSGTSIWEFPSDMQMFTNGPATADASDYLSGWTTAQMPELANGWGGNNIPRMSSPEFDTLSDQLSEMAIDDPRRNVIIMRMDDILSAESGAVIPLILRSNVSAFGRDIANTGPLNGWDSEYWNIAEWTRE